MRTRLFVSLSVLAAAVCVCPRLQAQAPGSAPVVASCPKKPGRILVDIAVRVLPGGREIPGEGSETEASYDLGQPPALQPGEHIELECMYGRPGSKTGTIPGRTFAPADRQSVALPPVARLCEFFHDPNRASCSR